MVEGGARIIQSFLKNELMDLLIITIAPIFVGPEAISATGDNRKTIKVFMIVFKYEILQFVKKNFALGKRS
jgi:riboflavin biosynthesis pyrimidine reductase